MYLCSLIINYYSIFFLLKKQELSCHNISDVCEAPVSHAFGDDIVCFTSYRRLSGSRQYNVKTQASTIRLFYSPGKKKKKLDSHFDNTVK